MNFAPQSQHWYLSDTCHHIFKISARSFYRFEISRTFLADFFPPRSDMHIVVNTQASPIWNINIEGPCGYRWLQILVFYVSTGKKSYPRKKPKSIVVEQEGHLGISSIASSVWQFIWFYATESCTKAKNSKIGSCFEASGSNSQGVGEQYVVHEPLVGGLHYIII